MRSFQFIKHLFIGVVSLGLAACGNVPDTTITTPAGSGSVSVVNIAAPLTTGVTADGSGTYTVVAQVVDSSNLPVSGATITFTVITGTGLISMNPPTASSAIDGTATVTISNISPTNANVVISASSNGVNSLNPVTLQFTGTGAGGGGGGGGTIDDIAINVGASVPADGTTTASIVITATDAASAAVAGSSITLTTSGSATITSLANQTTNAAGQATFTLINSTPETVILTVSGGGVVRTANLEFTSIVGSVIATAPASTSAPASGVDTIQITYTVNDNSVIPVAIAGQTVTFTAVGSLGGTPSVSPAAAVTDAYGQVSVTISDTTAESVTVTAAASGVTGTQVLSYTALPPANIILTSSVPSPAVISISGTGTQESATVTFQVVDVNNQPVQGSQLVDFSILNGGLNGGEQLTTSQAATISSLVNTVINSGTKAGTVQIRASLNATPTIFADVTVTITGGLPSGDGFGLSSDVLNIAGRATLGLVQNITAFVSDFFGNPVAPNIGLQLQTDFANTSGSSTFIDNGAGSSSATATVTSAFPQPIDGLVTLSAQTVGGVHAKVLSLAVDPNNSSIMYAGTDGGGVYKSIDAGLNWSHVGTPLKTIGASKFANLTGSIVRDLLLDPNNSSVIYAATEKGLFVSINAGTDWENITRRRRVGADNLGASTGAVCPANGYGETFSFSFDNTNVRSRTKIYVGASSTETTDYIMDASGIRLICVPGSALAIGTVISADYDTSSQISNVPFYAVAVDVTSYDLTQGYAGTIYVGTYGDGVWKTTTGGRSWFRASTMAAGSGVSFGLNVLSLSIDAAGTTLFAGSDGNGLFRTTDSATNWSKQTGTIASPINESVVQDVIFNGLDVWIAGKNAIHYSIDGGATWSTPTTNINATDITNSDARALVRDANDGTLYVATYGDILAASAPLGGIYSSSDGGVNWSKLTDIATGVSGAHKLDALALFGGVGPDILVSGSEGRLIAISADSGLTWSTVNGTSPNNLTNNLYTTTNLMHSGVGILSVRPIAATYQPMNDSTVPGTGLGPVAGPLPASSSFGSIYNNETHTFYVNLSDSLGNRLVPGTRISSSVDSGVLGGDIDITLVDGIYGATDYALSWTNDLATVSPDGDVSGRLTIAVTSPSGGDLTQTITRTMINPLNVASTSITADPYANPTAVPVSVAGGSNGAGGYLFTSGSGCDSAAIWTGAVYQTCAAAGGSNIITTASGSGAAIFYYPTPASGGTSNDSVTIRDLATGAAIITNITISTP